MYDAGDSTQFSVTTLKGGIGRMGGRFNRKGTCVHLWLIRVDVWQNPAQHCKAIIFQLKNNRGQCEQFPLKLYSMMALTTNPLFLTSSYIVVLLKCHLLGE